MKSDTKVKTGTIILASILLIGILALAYGFYESNSLIIYGSLIIIFPVSLLLPLQNVLFKRTTKRKFTINK